MNVDNSNKPRRFALLRGGVSRSQVADSPSPQPGREVRLSKIGLPALTRWLPNITGSAQLAPPRYYNSLGRLHGLLVIGVGGGGAKFLGLLGRSHVMQIEGGLFGAMITSLFCFASSPGLRSFWRNARSPDSGYARGALFGAGLAAALLMIPSGYASTCAGVISTILFSAYLIGRLASAKCALVANQTNPEQPRRGA